MLAAYSVFANGGYRIQPFLVKQILDDKGNVLAETQPEEAGDENRRVIDARNAYLIDSMLHDVVRRGTATRALSLKRGDLAGKTGTTNEFVDAWFTGYQPTVVGIAWIGFDQPRKLGNGETGGFAALPIWISYMQTALKGVPESFMTVPDGLVPVTITAEPNAKVVRELVYRENADAVPVAPDSEHAGTAPDTPVPAPSTGTTPAPVEERPIIERRG
jgi:penicillin-binding protein 1A